MSNLANKTEKRAIRELSKCLKYFDRLANLAMTAVDDRETTQAENLIRGVIESNGYRIAYSGKKERIFKLKNDN